MNTIVYKFTKNSKFPEGFRFFANDCFYQKDKCRIIIDTDCKCHLAIGSVKAALNEGRSIIDVGELADGEYEPTITLGGITYASAAFEKRGRLLQLKLKEEEVLGASLLIFELFERCIALEKAYEGLTCKINGSSTLTLT